MRRRKQDDKPAETEIEAGAEPSADEARPVKVGRASVMQVFVVTTPHGEGMRVFGVYSSEEKAEAAIEADPRNRVESRVLDADAE